MIDTDLFLRIFLIAYIIVYMLVLYVFNIKSFKKKYGIDPRAVDKTDTLMYRLQAYRNVIFLFIVSNIFVYSVFPKLYFLFVPIDYLDVEIMKIIGVVVLISSLLLTRLSQIQLREAWRIGIDRSEKKGTLITTGIYSMSRNPIALGMLLGTIGLFMVIPNMTTFTIIILVHLIFSIRILLEEEHLYKLHGDTYHKYRNKTRKWI